MKCLPAFVLVHLVVLCLATAASAQEHVQFAVRGKDKVLGTIRPYYESEAFLCDLEVGSVLKASVKSTQKTGPIPTLEVSLNGNVVPVSLIAKGRAAHIAPYTATEAGTYKVVVRGDGLRDGDYQLKVSFTKVRNRVTDLRDSALAGAFSDGPFVVGAVIDPDGGSVAVSNTYSPIDGSSVDIPPGALTQPTSVFIAEATVYPISDGVHPAGPAVEFGPSGTQFPEGKEATVTIPFDLSSFPDGTDALVVYVKDANGDITPVDGPYTFGVGTVTFVTSHFSTFQAATPQARGLPNYGYNVIRIQGLPDETPVLRGFVGVGTGYAYFTDGLGSAGTSTGSRSTPACPGRWTPRRSPTRATCSSRDRPRCSTTRTSRCCRRRAAIPSMCAAATPTTCSWWSMPRATSSSERRSSSSRPTAGRR